MRKKAQATYILLEPFCVVKKIVIYSTIFR